MKIPLLLLALTVLSGCSAGDANNRQQADQQKVPIDYVIDRANLLSGEGEGILDAYLAALEARTTDQVAVVTLPSLEGRPIEEVAKYLGNSWGVGQKGKNNGVLLVVAPVERKVRIQVGYGLESTLTNPICERIIQKDILPDFRARRFEHGIVAGVKAIVGILEMPARASLKKAA